LCGYWTELLQQSEFAICGEQLRFCYIFLWRRHRRRREMFELPPMDSYTRDSASSGITKEASVLPTKPAYLERYEAEGAQTYELDSVAERVELPLKGPRELPGSDGGRQRFQAYQSTTGYGNSYQSD
jgi:hypothetical protein